MHQMKQAGMRRLSKLLLMINTNFFLGKPDSFQDKCFVYPPLIEEAASVLNYSKYCSILTISQEELEDDVLEKDPKAEFVPTPLEYLLGNAYNNKEFEKLAQQAFEFFIKQPVTFFYNNKSIMIGDLKEKVANDFPIENLVFITEEEYFDFQNKIREAIGHKQIDPPVKDEDPRIKRMKAKARYRDRIKAKEGKGISFGTSVAAICCMDVGINPLNVGKISCVALKVLTDMYQDKEKYQLDINRLLAGASSKDVKPKYWIKNSKDE